MSSAQPPGHDHIDLWASADAEGVRNDLQIGFRPWVILKTWPHSSLTLGQISNLDAFGGWFGGAHAEATTHYLSIFSLVLLKTKYVIIGPLWFIIYMLATFIASIQLLFLFRKAREVIYTSNFAFLRCCFICILWNGLPYHIFTKNSTFCGILIWMFFQPLKSIVLI